LNDIDIEDATSHPSLVLIVTFLQTHCNW
jgi:hypothetical protein